ncbi:MAG: D-glycerate dehydrogenase [Chitinophagaceae bacterium]|nr:D-glycerate dehydrogenase [Chitinophagaceae bacterium]
MLQKILITRPIFPDVIARTREFFDVEVNEGARYTPEQLHNALHDKDGVILAGGEKINAATLEGLSRLKAICVSAAGFNNLDIEAITRAGIIATNSPGPADETVADYTWGLMIATARRLAEGDRWIRTGNWKGSVGSSFFGTNLCDKTLGIIGMGRIGQAIARRAVGFRMKVLYYNRRPLDKTIEEECQAAYVTKEDLLRLSDFVVLAVPLNAANYHIIGEQQLELMRPSAMLFNIARGGLIDEPALAKALREQKIAAAGLDVFEEEPSVYPGLLGLPNIVMTPHIGGGTWDAQHGLAMLAAENLIAALGLGPHAGHPPSIINPEVLKK